MDVAILGETTEKIPLALVRGLAPESVEKTQHHNAAMINRPVQEDLFR